MNVADIADFFIIGDESSTLSEKNTKDLLFDASLTSPNILRQVNNNNDNCIKNDNITYNKYIDKNLINENFEPMDCTPG